MSKTKIQLVAEIGCNHMGQLNLAKLIINQAKLAGANYVKFQKRDNKTLLSNKQYYAKHPVPHNSFGKTYGEHREYLEFNTNVHQKIFAYCKKNKIKFIVMYGQTEASPRMSYLAWSKFSEKIGSIGKALDGSKFKILSKTGKQVKKSFSTGELIYFGKNVSLGYANNLEDLKKRDINKGKLFTGDLAYKDNDDYFYIVGRKNRISKKETCNRFCS